jgi:hypothetical protein
MNEYEEWKSNDRLARGLRGEARRSRPEFSAALHERVLAAIHAANAPETTANVSARRGLRSQVLICAMSAAAAIAVTISLAMVFNGTRSTSRDHTERDRVAAKGNNPKRYAPQAATTHQESATKKEGNDIDSAVEELTSSASGISDWVTSTAGDGQWAGLDRDAQWAFATVTGPLPFDLTFSLAYADEE